MLWFCLYTPVTAGKKGKDFMYHMHYTPILFYKNPFYKNHQAEIYVKNVYNSEK